CRPDAERAWLCRLAAFAGGFELEAAEAVCADDGADSGDVLDVVARLVDKSLVVVEEQKGQTRCRLLEPVRQYALEKLEAGGEAGDPGAAPGLLHGAGGAGRAHAA